MDIYRGVVRYLNEDREYSVIDLKTNVSHEHCFAIGNGSDKTTYAIGTNVICVMAGGCHYILGTPEDTNEYKLNGFAVNNGRMLMAGQNLCLFLDSAGNIGIYQVSKDENKEPVLNTVWEYSMETEVLKQYVAAIETYIKGANCKSPNFSISRDGNDVIYQLSGKLNVADLSNRFVVRVQNPTTQSKQGSLYIKIDKLYTPVRAIPLLEPLSLESLELKIGPQSDGTLLEIDCNPIWKIKVDGLGNVAYKNMVVKIDITAIGDVNIKSGLAEVTISPTGVISILGTAITIGGAALTLNQVPNIPGGFCLIPVCPMTGAPHLTSVAPLKR